jgi:hypothetical protein
VTVQKIYLFIAIILQMGHDQSETHWRIIGPQHKIFTEFYSNTMKRDRFFHILRFLHFNNLTTKIILTRQMKIVTDCGKWELYFRSWMMHKLNITVQLNI